MKAGLVLLAHGARDPRWADPIARLRERIAQRSPALDVEAAFLEHLAPDLAGAVTQLVGNGCASITVVPLFLGQGGHVRRDVPERVEALRLRFPGVGIHVAPAIGDDPEVIDALASYCIGISAS